LSWSPASRASANRASPRRFASALAATKGYPATDVGETIARAHALAEQIDRPEHLVPLIYGQFAFHMIRSEHKRALLLACTSAVHRLHRLLLVDPRNVRRQFNVARVTPAVVETAATVTLTGVPSQMRQNE
jgi:hypothetical protein